MRTRSLGRRPLIAAGLLIGMISTIGPGSARGDDPPSIPVELNNYFPPAEEWGGWRSLVSGPGGPTADDKIKIREVAGVDWDRLRSAWDLNAATPGASGLLVVRKGFIVGEWYKNCDRKTRFNIYSSSKSYTSTAFGMILADFGDEPLPDGRKLDLDAEVCNRDWLPESLPLSDRRRATITVRNLLNMTSGLTEEQLPRNDRPFEWALGRVEDSPMRRLAADPGAAFHYSNAGVAHLVLVFRRAAGEDLFPFLKRRLFDQIGMEDVSWDQLGGGTTGGIGPYSVGYSGLRTTPRDHARFCYMSMHRGAWTPKRIVAEAYYDFAWAGTEAKPDYGGLWWRAVPAPGIPHDLVMTRGRNHNDGFIVPSLDLVFVRLGDGDAGTFPNPKKFESELVLRVLGAIVK